MLTSSYIFLGLMSSTFISDVYGLMQCILIQIFIPPHFKVTVTLVQHYVIKNGPFYGVSSLYPALLLSMTLSPTL